MGRLLPGSATTTHAVRAQYGVNPKAVMKWRHRSSVEEPPMGPKDVRSTVLSAAGEALCIAFRKHTLLPLDDCLHR